MATVAIYYSDDDGNSDGDRDSDDGDCDAATTGKAMATGEGDEAKGRSQTIASTPALSRALGLQCTWLASTFGLYVCCCFLLCCGFCCVCGRKIGIRREFFFLNFWHGIFGSVILVSVFGDFLD